MLSTSCDTRWRSALIAILVTHVLALVTGVDAQWLNPPAADGDLAKTFSRLSTVTVSWDSLNKSTSDLWVTSYDASRSFAHLLKRNVDISQAGTFEWTIGISTDILDVDNRFRLRFVPKGTTYKPGQLHQRASPGFYVQGLLDTVTSLIGGGGGGGAAATPTASPGSSPDTSAGSDSGNGSGSDPAPPDSTDGSPPSQTSGSGASLDSGSGEDGGSTSRKGGAAKTGRGGGSGGAAAAETSAASVAGSLSSGGSTGVDSDGEVTVTSTGTGAVSTSTVLSQGTTSHAPSISGAGVAGIVLGVIAVIGVWVGVFWYIRRSRQNRSMQQAADTKLDSAASSTPPTSYSAEPVPVTESQSEKSAVDAPVTVHEASGSFFQPVELPADNQRIVYHELP